jgi:hypothetical protein
MQKTQIKRNHLRKRGNFKMNIVYRKTLKGVEEIAFRSSALSEQLRPYLRIVDGAKSVDDLIQEYPRLAEVAMIFKSLMEAGYIELIAASAQVSVASSNIVNLKQTANGAFARPTPSPSNHEPVLTFPPPQPAQPKPARLYSPAQASQKLDYLKGQIIDEVGELLGHDASLVVSKIQQCQTPEDLQTILIGLKKIIHMYSGADEADAFVQKFSTLAKM